MQLIFWAFVFPWSLGYALVRIILGRTRLWTAMELCLAYPCGLAVIALWMFLLGNLGIAWQPATLYPPLTILLAGLILFQVRCRAASPPVTPLQPVASAPPDLICRVFMVVIITELILVYLRGTIFPIITWDAFSLYAYRVKVLFADRSLVNLAALPHNTYPLNIELIQLWICFANGGFNEQVIKYYFPVIFTCFIVIQYGFLRCYVSRKMSLLAVVMLVSANLVTFHAGVSYRDILMMFYNCGAIYLILLWARTRQRALLVLAGLLGGMGSFHKLEGLGYLGIHILLILGIILTRNRPRLSRESLQDLGAYLLLSVPISLWFFAYISLNIVPLLPTSTPITTPPLLSRAQADQNMSFSLHRLQVHFNLSLLVRLRDVLVVYGRNLFLTSNWNLVWALFILSLGRRRRIRECLTIKILLAGILLSFGVYIAGFTLTQHYYWAVKTNSVLSRSLIHFFPLVITVICLLNARALPADTTSGRE